MINKNVVSGAFVAAFLLPINSMGAVIVSDHFDNNSLSPDWQVVLENATGWTYSETGTFLTADDITSTVLDTGSGGAWADATIRQSFEAIDDFDLQAAFGWDSVGSTRAMQKLTVTLLDPANEIVARVGYDDAWVDHRGQKSGKAGASTTSTGSDTKQEI